VAALVLLSPPSDDPKRLQVDPKRRWRQIDSDDGGSTSSNGDGPFFFIFLFRRPHQADEKYGTFIGANEKYVTFVEKLSLGRGRQKLAQSR
jgi:hypothetical protein